MHLFGAKAFIGTGGPSKWVYYMHACMHKQAGICVLQKAHLPIHLQCTTATVAPWYEQCILLSIPVNTCYRGSTVAWTVTVPHIFLPPPGPPKKNDLARATARGSC
jgi:hypothetical protein